MKKHIILLTLLLVFSCKKETQVVLNEPSLIDTVVVEKKTPLKFGFQKTKNFWINSEQLNWIPDVLLPLDLMQKRLDLHFLKKNLPLFRMTKYSLHLLEVLISFKRF